MSEKRTFILCAAPHPSRRLALQAVQDAPEGMAVVIQEPKRTDRQNNLIQPMIREWAQKHPPILVNGEPTKLGADDWRHVLVASFRNESQRLALFDGALILLGASSRDLTVKELPNFVEYLHASATQRGFCLSRIEQEPAA